MGPRFFEEVYRVTACIPRGRVASYGQIAALLGRPRAGRTVGWALASLTDEQAAVIPWHRVLNRMGAISLPDRFALLQRMLLEAEGVEFLADGRVDMRRYGWEGMEVVALRILDESPPT